MGDRKLLCGEPRTHSITTVSVWGRMVLFDQIQIGTALDAGKAALKR
jgi:hypothetical protein